MLKKFLQNAESSRLVTIDTDTIQIPQIVERLENESHGYLFVLQSPCNPSLRERPLGLYNKDDNIHIYFCMARDGSGILKPY